MKLLKKKSTPSPSPSHPVSTYQKKKNLNPLPLLPKEREKKH
jgi:hypothetical protein